MKKHNVCKSFVTLFEMNFLEYKLFHMFHTHFIRCKIAIQKVDLEAGDLKMCQNFPHKLTSYQMGTLHSLSPDEC